MEESRCVFVYGTLKTGYSNHFLLEDEQYGVAKLLGRGTTCDKYPLVIGHYPFLLNERGMGKVCCILPVKYWQIINYLPVCTLVILVIIIYNGDIASYFCSQDSSRFDDIVITQRFTLYRKNYIYWKRCLEY